MNPARVDLILRQLDGLPPLPGAVVRVLEATSRPDADARHVVPLIESDPALASRVLQLVQRTDQPVRGVTSIERAVVLLGFSTLRNALLAMGVAQVFPARAVAGGEAGRPEPARQADFWTHSLAVGCAAELLAERMGKGDIKRRADAGEAFCCGLLHDLGKLALYATLPKSYERVIGAADALRGDIAEVERQVIGVDHCTAGRRLADRWRLPPALRDVIWLHNQPPESLPDALAQADARHETLVLLVTLADQLARGRHLGYSGNYAYGVPRGLLLRRLGITDADVDYALERLVERMGPRSSVLGIQNAQSDQLYKQAIDRADRELVQTHEQLQEQSQRLRNRTRCFRALAELGHELDPGAAAGDVLASIAQTASEALGCGPVLTFGIPTDAPAAELVLVEEGRVATRGLADLEGEAPALRLATGPAEATGLVRAASQELEWLLAAHGPALRGNRRWWVRLEGEGGQTVGGVVWGGGADEPSRLSAQLEEIGALCVGWSLALRTAQARESAERMAEQLADANRRLAEAQEQRARDRTTLAVAELAAGAAHEMNNPLMVISGRSQLLYHALKEERHKQAALAIYQNAQRLSDMITQLMRFARPDPASVVAAPVEALVAEALSLVHDLPERAGRTVDLSLPELPPVRVDRGQVARGLANVLENALQATADKRGRIEVHGALDAAGTAVVLGIIDNGGGMDADTLRHAFDPYFSRKRAGRRRGMGLPVALRLIEVNGGSLRLDSREGVGTRAIITLPVDVAAESAVPLASPVQASSPQRLSA